RHCLCLMTMIGERTQVMRPSASTYPTSWTRSFFATIDWSKSGVGAGGFEATQPAGGGGGRFGGTCPLLHLGLYALVYVLMAWRLAQPQPKPISQIPSRNPKLTAPRTPGRPHSRESLLARIAEFKFAELFDGQFRVRSEHGYLGFGVEGFSDVLRQLVKCHRLVNRQIAL